MNLKALHYATLGIDITFCVWFVLCFLGNCFAEAMSGMDHSSNHAANARRRRILHISYSITILLNIIGFFLLFSLTGYYYYQIIAKAIICIIFLIWGLSPKLFWWVTLTPNAFAVLIAGLLLLLNLRA